MRIAITLFAGVLSWGTAVAAQQPDAAQPQAAQPVAATESGRQMTLPAGTKVLLQLKSPIDTKSAHPGDGIYCQTSFPVTEENTILIPAGTYVKGKIMRVQRAGRVKGRAEIQVHFTTLIYPNGYSVELPGALDSTPGAEHHTVSDKEGTVKADGQKGKDAAEVGTWGASGAGIGALGTGSLKGAAIGGAGGAGLGLIKVLFSRGQDVRLETGSSLEMVLQRPLTLEVGPASTTRGEVVPRSDSSSLQPAPAPRPADAPKKRTRIIPGVPLPN
jgi:hypothetical protein